MIRISLAAAVVALVTAVSSHAIGGVVIAYSDQNGDLYLSSDGGATSNTIDSGDTVFPLAISPNGKNVLVLLETSAQLALVPVGGGSPTEISGTDDANSGSLSPDGATIVFTTNDGVYTVPAAGGTPAKIVSTPDGATDSLPTYAPSGKEVAFVRQVFDADDNETDTLELVPSSGGTVTGLATGVLSDPSSGGHLSFSPNGSRIAYAGSFDNTGVFTVAVGGGAPSQLTSDIDYWPNYSPDGSRIYFSRDGSSTNAVATADNDVDELWSVGAGGDGAAVIQQGDYENVAVGAPPAAGTSGGGASSGSGSGSGSGGSSSGGGTTSSPTTTVTKPPGAVSAKGIAVTVRGRRYTVKWRGKATKWKVTLKVGKKIYAAKVAGKLHAHTFVVKTKGRVFVSVIATH